MYYVILTYDTDSNNTSELDSVQCVAVYSTLQHAREGLLKHVKLEYPASDGYELDQNEDEVLIWADGDFIAKYWIQGVEYLY